MLIDSHCHLHDPQFFTEEEALEALARAKKAGVEKIICIGTDPDDSLVARDFAEKHEGVDWTYGIHPSEATTRAGVALESGRRGVRSLARRGLAPAARGDGPAGRSPRK